MRGRRRAGIILKSDDEIEAMARAGAILAGALKAMARAVRPGIPTSLLERIGEDYIRSHGAEPSFLGYTPPGASEPYPSAVCISVNDVVVHGVPSDSVVLAEGDIVGMDAGACVEGRHADAATTVAVGAVDPRVGRLVETTRRALDAAIAAVEIGGVVSDISAAIQETVEGSLRGSRTGMVCIRDLAGHGVGRSVHEEPSVPSCVDRRDPEVKLVKGMTLAIEPMTSLGAAYTRRCPIDKWGARTADGSMSAHFEHTVAVSDDGAQVLTLPVD